jgi:zinc protease
MKKHLYILPVITLLMLSSTTLPAQTGAQAELIEVVGPSADGINIPYKKYRYPNGLTLIIHEDDSDPIVYVDVTYHVGSARETPGRSGFAHFFEHMMFQGSDNVGDEQHFAIVTESGGTLNGTTNRDRTNYFETMPANQLETALWLEADRMGFFLDAVTEKKFEIQRATVKNERGQNYDNRPYGLVGEKIGEALYPFGHPYSWLTIGYQEDIDQYTLENLKNFFLRWYGPNNATLTVAGQLDEAEVLALVGKYFGSIPRGPEVVNMPDATVTLPEDRYISYEDNIRFPLLSMTFPGPPMNTREEAALDIAAYLIGGRDNKNAPMYQRLIKTQKALQASTSNPASELAGQFQFSVVAYPGITLADMEKELRSIVEDFVTTGIDEAAMKEYIQSNEADIIYSLQSVQRKGSMLAAYETFTGNANFMEEDLARFRTMTADEVMAAFKKYIYGQYSVILSAYPKGQEALKAAPDNYSRPAFPENFKPDLSEYEGLVYNKGKDNFDRSLRPKSGKNPVVEVPAFWTAESANGVKIVGTPYIELPITNISLFFKAGQMVESIDKAGLAVLTSTLMKEGTTTLSSEEFAAKLKAIGSRISVSSSEEDIVVSVSTLNKNMDATIDLLRDMLLNPRFDAADFEREQKAQIQAIQNAKTNAGAIAQSVMGGIGYPEDHIFSKSSTGTEASVAAITLEDVKNFYSNFINPSTAEVIIVGNISKTDLKGAKNLLAFLDKMPKKPMKLPAKVGVKVPKQTTIYFSHKDRSPQSQIMLGGEGLYYDGMGDYYKANIVNYPLGGMFNSRININLREDKGYTYGARTGFSGTEMLNLFTGSTSVRADATDSAVVEIMKEITQYVADGISEEELAFTKSSIGQRDALKYETTGQKALFMRQLLRNGLDKDLVSKQLDILTKMTKADADAIIRQYIRPGKLAIVVVGDRALIYDKLVALGYPVVEVDMYGKPVDAK